MPDIAIVWDPARMRGDWAVTAGQLQTGNDLESAVLVSLFTHRVLPTDIPLPPGAADDRRGVWFDSYSQTPWGSRLWTLRRAVKSDAAALLQQAQDICSEALQWLIDDGVAQSVTVRTWWMSATAMGILVTIAKPPGPPQRFQYAWAWNGLS